METLAGKITHYYSELGVASVLLTGQIAIGDLIHVKGHTTDYEQKVESMQLQHRGIEIASPGQKIGLSVRQYVRRNDHIYIMNND